MKHALRACLFLLLGAWATSPFAAVFVSINIAPPLMPIYAQPPPPADDFLWMPGYWAYDDGYFWVPGTWVLAPRRGYLWTPGYWTWDDGLYYWNGGYWGPTVGYYGGVYYGYGYYGSGYYGGRWDGDHFYYNSAVNNVSVTTIHNTYRETVNHNAAGSRLSYNGGRSGTTERPTARDRDAERARHLEPTAEQVQHEHGARDTRALRASVNNGSPPVAATRRSGAFTDRSAQPGRRDEARPPVRDHERVAAPAELPARDTRARSQRGRDDREPVSYGEQPVRSRPDSAPQGERAGPQEQGAREPGRNEKHQKPQDGNGPEGGSPQDAKR